MDDNVDLTRNRDFRKRWKSPLPRNCLKKNDTSISFSLGNNTITQISTTFDGSTTGWLNFNNGIYTTTNYDDYNYLKNNKNICDCCGRDITRLPWQKKMYLDLCKKCFLRSEHNIRKRIPWK